MKIAPIYRVSLKCDGVVCRIVHTGRHDDRKEKYKVEAGFNTLNMPMLVDFLYEWRALHNGLFVIASEAKQSHNHR